MVAGARHKPGSQRDERHSAIAGQAARGRLRRARHAAGAHRHRAQPAVDPRRRRGPAVADVRRLGCLCGLVLRWSRLRVCWCARRCSAHRSAQHSNEHCGDGGKGGHAKPCSPLAFAAPRDLRRRAAEALDPSAWTTLYCARALRTSRGVSGLLLRAWPHRWALYPTATRELATGVMRSWSMCIRSPVHFCAARGMHS